LRVFCFFFACFACNRLFSSQIFQRIVTRVTFIIFHLLLFGNVRNAYESYVLGSLRLLLRIFPHAVVCRATLFGRNVQLTALRRDGILSGNCPDSCRNQVRAGTP
jgi:hypothetical protein